MSARSSESPRDGRQCLLEREAALDAWAPGMLPPIPFLHFSWSFAEEAGGQQGTDGSWEGEREQHHKLPVLPGALNPM